LVLLLIFLAGIFWRFANYSHRWVLNQDQARDATIALYSLQTHQLPLLGSPSSAGPFNFGPLYDWLVVLVTWLFPFPSGPWVAFTLFSCLTVLIFFQIGSRVINPAFGLILALFTAFSPQQVYNAPDMLNTTIVFFLFSLSLLFLCNYIKLYHPLPGFLFAFFLGFTLNCHFQTLGLLAILGFTAIVTLLFSSRRLVNLVSLSLGFLLAFLPILIFDFQRNHVWSQSVIEYYTHGVNKFTLVYRWLTDLKDFWPQTLGQVVTGYPQSGYLFLVLIATALLIVFRRRLSLPSFWWLMLLTFLIQVILIRYYKGVRSHEYLIVFHPFLIFFASWALYQIISVLPKIGYLLLSLYVIAAASSNLRLIYTQPSQAELIYSIKNQIDSRLSGSSVDLYTLNGTDMLISPLFYLYYHDHRISPSGYRLGTCLPSLTSNPCPPSGQIIFQKDNYVVYDLSSYTSDELVHLGYAQLTPQSYYSRLFVNYGP
jgi:4-amino-4-deoxy-L-arabinose transferase-like glycosyltransferase